jgi:hypothetical protein
LVSNLGVVRREPLVLGIFDAALQMMARPGEAPSDTLRQPRGYPNL